MTVFNKITLAAGGDENGHYWDLEDAQGEISWSHLGHGRIPRWSVRLSRAELYELFLTILGEFTRMPLNPHIRDPDTDHDPF